MDVAVVCRIGCRWPVYVLCSHLTAALQLLSWILLTSALLAWMDGLTESLSCVSSHIAMKTR